MSFFKFMFVVFIAGIIYWTSETKKDMITDMVILFLLSLFIKYAPALLFQPPTHPTHLNQEVILMTNYQMKNMLN